MIIWTYICSNDLFIYSRTTYVSSAQAFIQVFGPRGVGCRGVISTFSWGGGNFFYLFFNATGLLKNLKKQHFICSNLTLFIVPFFFLSFFFFFFFFFLFSFFFFFLGGGRRPPPAPLKWRPWLAEPREGVVRSRSQLITARGSVSSPQRGLGRKAQPPTILVHLRLKRRHLVLYNLAFSVKWLD